ncbi:MAG: fumarylacetoacetate hydrolase family protein [bacterium]|nr:fumarylacetoacetate hydrolase family protein [Candidatus Kapabacteria bacterium]
MHTTLPVGKMLCVGKNYEKHAREMGSGVPADPVIFMKPATALVRSGGVVQIPRVSNEMHHELELVVVIGSTARDVSEADAMDCVLGYAVGLDMTLRDLQSTAKTRGEPWTIAKGFDTSAPISEVVAREMVPDPHALALRLTVNGEVRQQGSTRDMILTVPRILSYLSSIFTLERGDVVFTGTPEGVGQVIAGDRLFAEIEGLVAIEVTVSEQARLH